ncbi:hypothetical protein CCACVL1_01927 [Corchorus capsularis]|uniref:Uncharacterized protein n=1 Tax=Corchorus capsularis TaxID=210143 RepID=A0A1R3KEB2_COCAP|nr:hypothetical protein CCACVL1_01927 [Corchorus capsularis]
MSQNPTDAMLEVRAAALNAAKRSSGGWQGYGLQE